MPDREIDVTFGVVLRKLRKRRGLTQEELAEEADLHRTYIGLLEVGRRSPSLRTLRSICVCLGISLTEMMAALDAELEPSTVTEVEGVSNTEQIETKTMSHRRQ